jgi:hypothetical protein
MPKKSVKSEFKNFSQGLITEATPINFPPNAAQEIQNFILNRDGSLQRRPGINSEPGGVMMSTGLSAENMSYAPFHTYTWYNVNGESGRSFVCVTYADYVHFYDLSSDIISATGYRGSLSLSPLGGGDTVHKMTSVNGILIVVAGVEKVGIVSYDGINFSLSTTVLKTRDIWGLSNPYSDVDRFYQPTVLDNTHMYNLYNQSWALPRRNSASTLVDPTAEYFNKLGHYPSDTEAVWEGLKYNASFSGDGPTELFFPKTYLDTFGANSRVAKGFFIIDLLRRGESRSYQVGLNSAKNSTAILAQSYGGQFPWGLAYEDNTVSTTTKTATVGSYTFNYTASNLDYTPGGAKVCCTYAGRVWYGGFEGTVVGGDARSPKLSSYVAFSQLVKNDTDINKCYQEGDPSSRDASDLVDTDGGLICISGAEEIIEMRTINDVLLVFCSNGVWSISGGNNYGFSATNYKVVKVTSFGCTSAQSVIDDSDDVYFWSFDGIYNIANNQMGDLVANNITIGTIAKLYDEVAIKAKETVSGVMDTVGRKVRWIWYEGDLLTTTTVCKELVLDLMLKGFTVNVITSPSTVPTMAVAPFKSNPFSAGNVVNLVTVQGSPVTFFGSNVVSSANDPVDTVLSTRYVVAQVIDGLVKFTFGYYYDTTFTDWVFADGTGVDATAYFITGSITGGDASVAKQVPYLTMFMRKTESGLDNSFNLLNPSSVLIQSQWNWANAVNSNKWGPQQQAYRVARINMPTTADGSIDNGFPVVVTRNKLRGRGKAFALRVDTEPGKDCQIVGWDMNLNGNEIT